MSRRIYTLERDPYEDRGYYVYFAATDTMTGVTVEFYTNKALEGLFHKRADGTYNQSSGTLQFSMPESPAGQRRKLRALLDIEDIRYGYCPNCGVRDRMRIDSYDNSVICDACHHWGFPGIGLELDSLRYMDDLG